MITGLALSMIACNGPAEPTTAATTGKAASVPEFHPPPPPLEVDISPRVINLFPNQVGKALVGVTHATASCMSTQLDASTSLGINATFEQTQLVPPDGETTLGVSIAPGAQVLGETVVYVTATCVNTGQSGAGALQLCVPMTPATCSTYGACGQSDDHCGGTVNCGGCSTGQACISNQCQDYPCTTASCCRADGGRWVNGQCVYNM
jgi:hypothetical protein